MEKCLEILATSTEIQNVFMPQTPRNCRQKRRSDVMGDLKPRGKVISGGRVTIDSSIRKSLGIEEGTLYEQEPYGSDKVLITFFKVKK